MLRKRSHVAPKISPAECARRTALDHEQNRAFACLMIMQPNIANFDKLT